MSIIVLACSLEGERASVSVFLLSVEIIDSFFFAQLYIKIVGEIE